jgi:outer membrane protein assembly factor BamD
MKYILSLILSALLTGCFIFGDPVEFDETLGQSPSWVLARAELYAETNDWQQTIQILEKGEQRFPNSPLSPQFKLNLAYAYYKFNQVPNAIAMIDKYIRLYPNHPTIDYAYYLKGVVTFQDRGLFNKVSMQDISDRDVQQLKISFNALKELTAVYPESKYYQDGVNRMTYLMNKLAEHEIHVARYYMRRKAYVAAINRAQYTLENYPQTIHQEEALVIMISGYEYLGIKDLQKDTEKILKINFPESKFDKQKLEIQKKEWWKFWESLYS